MLFRSQSKKANYLFKLIFKIRDEDDNDDDGDDDDNNDDDDDICSTDLEPKNRKVHLPEPFYKYVVDFKRMQQTNTHTHYMRAIRRRESQT